MTLKLTLQELAAFNGVSDAAKPVYMAIRGRIYDVSSSPFYRPGGAYGLFAGKEVARALAIMSVKPEDCTGELGDATEKQLKTLEDWEAKLAAKYPVVGEVVKA